MYNSRWVPQCRVVRRTHLRAPLPTPIRADRISRRPSNRTADCALPPALPRRKSDRPVPHAGDLAVAHGHDGFRRRLGMTFAVLLIAVLVAREAGGSPTLAVRAESDSSCATDGDAMHAQGTRECLRLSRARCISRRWSLDDAASAHIRAPRWQSNRRAACHSSPRTSARSRLRARTRTRAGHRYASADGVRCASRLRHVHLTARCSMRSRNSTCARRGVASSRHSPAVAPPPWVGHCRGSLGRRPTCPPRRPRSARPQRETPRSSQPTQRNQ